MKKAIFLLIVPLMVLGCARQKIVESTYEDGSPQLVHYYRKLNGQKVLEEEISYYPGSKKKMEGKYRNNLRDGKWQAWYENGKLWSEGEYRDGKRTGMGIAYHPNGKKYIEGMYKEDERVGLWKFYDSLGNMVKQVNFDEVKALQDNDSTSKKN